MFRRNAGAAVSLRLAPIAVALAFGLATACSTVSPAAGLKGERVSPTTARLHVENQAFEDRVIYVVRSGTRVRLGTVRGEDTTNFVIPSSFVVGGSTLRFLAHPIGGIGADVSEDIDVYPGDDVVLTIEGS